MATTAASPVTLPPLTSNQKVRYVLRRTDAATRCEDAEQQNNSKFRVWPIMGCSLDQEKLYLDGPTEKVLGNVSSIVFENPGIMSRHDFLPAYKCYYENSDTKKSMAYYLHKIYLVRVDKNKWERSVDGKRPFVDDQGIPLVPEPRLEPFQTASRRKMFSCFTNSNERLGRKSVDDVMELLNLGDTSTNGSDSQVRDIRATSDVHVVIELKRFNARDGPNSDEGAVGSMVDDYGNKAQLV